jgi:hypothetical protein
VRQTFRIEPDGALRLIETAYPSVGPGLPAGSTGTWTIEGGLIVTGGRTLPSESSGCGRCR